MCSHHQGLIREDFRHSISSYFPFPSPPSCQGGMETPSSFLSMGLPILDVFITNRVMQQGAFCDWLPLQTECLWNSSPFPEIHTMKPNPHPESACNAGDLGSIPGLGRSPGEGKGYPLQHSGLENSMDCIVYRVAESRTRLSNFHSLTHSLTAFWLSFQPFF